MNSRERVNLIVNHQEADIVPIGIGGCMSCGFQVDAYIALLKYLGLYSQPPKVYEQFQMLARVEDPILQALHGDIIMLENPVETWGLRNAGWKEWENNKGNTLLMPRDFNPIINEEGYICLYDQSGNCVAYMPPNGIYFDRTCENGFSDKIEYVNPEEWKKTIPLYSQEDLRDLEANARCMFEETSYAIFGGFCKGSIGTFGLFAGHTFSDWLMLLVSEPDYAGSILKAAAERTIENAELYIQAVGKYIDIICVSGFDFGTQDRELFNPSIFRDLYLPNYKLINDYIHANCRAKTFFHSCGSIPNIIPDFIKAGTDIINPVQTNAAGMEPAELKEKYGTQITFCGGGAETQTVMPFGTREEVKKHVKERIKIFAPGGGFIFSQVHNLQPGVPPENIMAMIETVLEYGQYPMQ